MLSFNNSYGKILAIVLLITGSIFTGYTVNIFEGTFEVNPINTSQDSDLSYADVLRLKPNMALYEVEAILGKGVRVSVDNNSVSYIWRSSSQKSILCIFDNDYKLISFEQQGLN